jgi:periplasmic divalent cation tolerance protein
MFGIVALHLENNHGLVAQYHSLVTNSARIILSTVGTRGDAERIADTLVTERLAACVNIVPGVKSVYWWDDAVQHDEEQLLVMKSVEGSVDALRERLHAIHPYDLPEFVVLTAADISPRYLDWLEQSTKS